MLSDNKEINQQNIETTDKWPDFFCQKIGGSLEVGVGACRLKEMIENNHYSQLSNLLGKKKKNKHKNKLIYYISLKFILRIWIIYVPLWEDNGQLNSQSTFVFNYRKFQTQNRTL